MVIYSVKKVTIPTTCIFHLFKGGRVVRWCWVNFQCRGVLLISIIVGQGRIALAVGAGGGGLDIFSLIYHFSLLSPILWETARYRLKYCLKGPLNPKQPTNQGTLCIWELPEARVCLGRHQGTKCSEKRQSILIHIRVIY